jgi:hypothetical protein
MTSPFILLILLFPSRGKDVKWEKQSSKKKDTVAGERDRGGESAKEKVR